MRIIPNQRFKHDRESYEQGNEYNVSDRLASHFKQAGWVGDHDVQSGDTALNIQDGQLGQAAEVK